MDKFGEVKQQCGYGMTNTSSIIRAYIDIETTGLDPASADLTVVGIYIEQDERRRVVQLYERSLTRDNLIAELAMTDIWWK